MHLNLQFCPQVSNGKPLVLPWAWRQVAVYYNRSTFPTDPNVEPKGPLSGFDAGDHLECTFRCWVPDTSNDTDVCSDVYGYLNDDDRPNAHEERCVSMGDVIVIEQLNVEVLGSIHTWKAYAVTAVGFLALDLIEDFAPCVLSSWPGAPVAPEVLLIEGVKETVTSLKEVSPELEQLLAEEEAIQAKSDEQKPTDYGNEPF